jgi:hypothetical protein
MAHRNVLRMHTRRVFHPNDTMDCKGTNTELYHFLSHVENS